MAPFDNPRTPLPSRVADKFRAAIGRMKDAEAGAIELEDDGHRTVLHIELLHKGEPVGEVRWVWVNGSDTVAWDGLFAPPDDGWLSFLGAKLTPIAAEMGFKRIEAPSVTPKLAALLPLSGLEEDENGVLAGDLEDRDSRLWSYLDFKARRRTEPQWRKDLRAS